MVITSQRPADLAQELFGFSRPQQDDPEPFGAPPVVPGLKHWWTAWQTIS